MTGVVTVTAAATGQLAGILEPLAADINRVAVALPDDQQRLDADILNRISALHRRHARTPAPGRPDRGANP